MGGWQWRDRSARAAVAKLALEPCRWCQKCWPQNSVKLLKSEIRNPVLTCGGGAARLCVCSWKGAGSGGKEERGSDPSRDGADSGSKKHGFAMTEGRRLYNEVGQGNSHAIDKILRRQGC